MEPTLRPVYRAAMVPVWAASSLQITGRLTRAVWAMAERGDWHQDQFPENRALTTDLTLGYLGTLRAFLPQELRPLLDGAGMRVLRCGGLGSLASLCTPRAVQQTQKDEALWRSYLDLCEYYDLEVLLSGPGTRQRAGLIALAIRPSF